MVKISDLKTLALEHSQRITDSRNTLICYEDSNGQIVYAKGARVVPHPKTGEVVVVLDSKG